MSARALLHSQDCSTLFLILTLVVSKAASSTIFCLFVRVLWHINHCRLLIAKSIFTQKNPFQTIQFSISKQFNCQKIFLFQAIQFSQTVLFQTIQVSVIQLQCQEQFYFNQSSLAYKTSLISNSSHLRTSSVNWPSWMSSWQLIILFYFYRFISDFNGVSKQILEMFFPLLISFFLSGRS